MKEIIQLWNTGKIVSWVKELLSDRKQRLTIKGSKSEWRTITSGIPQGSVLGPILFLIFINDFPDVISVCMKLFADDGKLFSRVKLVDKRIVLQDNITTAENWAEKWKMFFKKSKCHHLHVGKHDTISTYKMKGETGPVEIEKS